MVGNTNWRKPDRLTPVFISKGREESEVKPYAFVLTVQGQGNIFCAYETKDEALAERQAFASLHDIKLYD